MRAAWPTATQASSASSMKRAIVMVGGGVGGVLWVVQLLHEVCVCVGGLDVHLYPLPMGSGHLCF